MPTMNNTRRAVSDKYGYGVLDADVIVSAAEDWVSLDPAISYTVRADVPPLGTVCQICLLSVRCQS